MGYLDNTGLTYFWGKIKSYVSGLLADKVDKVSGKGLSTEDYTTAEQTKLSNIEPYAEVNQNAFNTVTVDSTDISATTDEDTIEIIAGTNIALTADASNKTVTISVSGTLMSILSYGSSTWSDFITAYNKNAIVYCRASSNSNPASGSQGRMAFMAYINNSSSPTEVEFQYYRSVSSHSDSQQGDQVFVYKLNSSGTWSVTTREAASKVAVGTGLSKSYSSGTITLSMDSTLKSKIDGIAEGAEVNQNAFGVVTANSTDISAGSETDTIEFVEGSNVTITPDATNKTITISAADTTYTQMDQTTANTGTSTTGQLISAKVLHDTIEGMINTALTNLLEVS